MPIMPIIPSEEEGEYSNLNQDEIDETKADGTRNEIKKPEMQSDVIILKEKLGRRIINNLKNKIFISYFLAYFLYFLSLEGCYDGEFACSKNSKFTRKKLIEEIISVVIMIVLIQLIIFNKISKKHLIHTAIIFGLFFLYSHGYEYPDHGFFNFVYYFIIICFIYLIIKIPHFFINF